MNQRLTATERSEDNSQRISWINIVLAIWVIISPFVLAFSQSPKALWNNVATGIAIGVLAIIRTSLRQQPGWSWANVILGIWLIISPLVLTFVVHGNALWNNIILGIIITIIAWTQSVPTATQVTVH